MLVCSSLQLLQVSGVAGVPARERFRNSKFPVNPFIGTGENLPTMLLAAHPTAVSQYLLIESPAVPPHLVCVHVDENFL